MIKDRFGNKMDVGLIGVVTDKSAGNFRIVRYGPLQSVGQGALESWRIVARTGSYVANIFSGREKADQLGGPIRVAQVSGQMATLGPEALIQLIAVLSVSIGLLNLMPIPLARRRPSRLLCDRGHERPAGRRTRTGDGLPLRLRARIDAHGLRHLERRQPPSRMSTVRVENVNRQGLPILR